MAPIFFENRPNDLPPVIVSRGMDGAGKHWTYEPPVHAFALIGGTYWAIDDSGMTMNAFWFDGKEWREGNKRPPHKTIYRLMLESAHSCRRTEALPAEQPK